MFGEEQQQPVTLIQPKLALLATIIVL